MTIPDEKFFAWLDGELTETEAAEMEARVTADPELARLAVRHRSLKERLERGFDPVIEAPIPAPLLAALREPRLADSAPPVRPADRRVWSLPQWIAVAASLAAGLVVGSTILPRPGAELSAPVAVDGGRVFAAAALNEALYSQLANDPRQGAIRVGITFRNVDGQICRTFEDSGANGVACRAGGKWLIRGLFSSEETAGGDYRMASGADPNLAAMVDSMIDGQPFNAAEERAARANAWR